MKNNILKGNLLKSISFLAGPIILMNFFNALYQLIDTYFVTTIGVNETAAVTFVGPVNQMITSIGVGLSIAGASLVAREIGKQNKVKEFQYANNLIIISIMLGILVAGSCSLFSENILIQLGVTENLLLKSDIYFKYTVLAAPFQFISAAYLGIRRAQGDTFKPSVLFIMSIVIKVFLTYVFVVHLSKGIISLALATLIANLSLAAAGMYSLYFSRNKQVLKIDKNLFNKSIVYDIIRIGIPSVLEKSATSYGFLMINQRVLFYGEAVLVAYGVTNRINSLAFASVTGIGTATATIISQNLGAKNYKRISQTVKVGYLTALALSIVTMTIIWTFRANIAGQFSEKDPLVFQHIMNAMSTYSFSIIPWGFFQIVIGFYQGIGKTKYNLYLSLIRLYAFRLPLVIILMKLFAEIGEYSIWYAMLFSNILTAIIAIAMRKKEQKKLI